MHGRSDEKPGRIRVVVRMEPDMIVEGPVEVPARVQLEQFGGGAITVENAPGIIEDDYRIADGIENVVETDAGRRARNAARRRGCRCPA